MHPRTAARHVQKYGLTSAFTANQLAVLAHRLCPSHDTNHIDLSAMSSPAHGITVPNLIDDLDFDSSNPPIMVIEDVHENGLIGDLEPITIIELPTAPHSPPSDNPQLCRRSSSGSETTVLSGLMHDLIIGVDATNFETFDDLDIYNCDTILPARELSSSSSLTVGGEDSDDDSSKETLMLRLRAFAREARVSRRHMNALMAIFRDYGFTWFPLDYRTLILECARFDKTVQRSTTFAQPAEAVLVLVCGKCWLSPFDELLQKSAVLCAHCQVTTVRCPRPMCYTKCVLTMLLGGRAMSSLVRCLYCEIGSESSVARRTFRFPLENYVRNAFSRSEFGLSLMAPFTGFCELKRTHPNEPFKLHSVPNWYDAWKSHLEMRLFSTEIWDGKLFRENPVWRIHGPRSLLFVISLDWYPPFKQRDYTIGILTVSPANLSSSDRAKRINTWILAVIEGPDEPTHVIECIRPCFEEIRRISDHGLEVFDAATRQPFHLFVSAPLVSADSPACAKLGNLYGHSSYFPCVACEYKGVVCGCKPSKKIPLSPARWDNRSFRPGVSPRPILISGHPERNKHSGEHIVFLDDQVLLPFHVRLETHHRAGERVVAQMLETVTNQAAIDRERKVARSNGPSALSLLRPDDFKFTQGFSIEAMHVVIKGTLLRMWAATVADKYQKQWYNVQYYEGGLKTLKHRFTKFKFPIGSPSANKFVARRHSLKAEELFTILKVCGPFVFNNLVPKSVVIVWALFTKLYTNLLHYHVSKSWMNAPTGLRQLVQLCFSKYLSVFGPCHMPSNFHRLLHCWLDFTNWGPLRSHWAFPYERIYGALSATSRMQNRSQVTMSVVNSIHLLYVVSSDAEVNTPGRCLKNPPLHVLIDAPDVTSILSLGHSWVHTFNMCHSRRWHTNEFLVLLSAGCSLSTDCFFVLVGILSPVRKSSGAVPFSESTSVDRLASSDTFFVLRSVQTLRARQFFDQSATFYTLSTQTIKLNEHMGSQVVYSSSRLLSAQTAICPVTQYLVDPYHVVLIPTFGMIEFK